MALVAPPTSVWRDPNLMANPTLASMGMTALGLHPGLHSSGGLSPTTPQVDTSYQPTKHNFFVIWPPDTT